MNAIKKVLSNDKEGSHAKETSRTTTGSTAPTTAGTGATHVTESPISPAGKTAAAEYEHGSQALAGSEVPNVGSTHKGTHHGSVHSNDFDPATATHSHSHLKHVTQETQHQHEIEEVERLKEQERHITHIQHHTQKIADEEHLPETHVQRAIPQTHVEERHVSTDADRAAFAGLAKERDTVEQGLKERTVVDLGEKVNESVHHHNVIQPVLMKDTHAHNTIHTTIPVHEVIHEAPIVHQSVDHGVISKDDFLRQGGVLGSNLTHDKADVFANGQPERQVEGVGEELARKLHLSGTGVDTTPTSAPSAI